MNDEVLQDLFNRAVSLGYKQSIEDFKTLINTNDQVLNDNFQYVKSKGFGQEIEDFKVLVGGQEQVVEDPLKKKEDTIQEVKEDTVSVSEDGSLASQDVQPRAYGQQTPLDFGGALSLQPKSEEEESAMLSAAKSYAEGLPEPKEKEFNLAEARLKDETEQTFAEPSMEEDPRTFASMFGEKFKREKDDRTEYSEGTLPFVPVSSPEERERIDLENYTFDANSANNLRREMFAKQGIDSPETDEALKDKFISDKELDEYVERRKKFLDDIENVVTKNKREKAAIYSAIAEAQGLEPLTMGEYKALYEQGKSGAKDADRSLFKEFTEQVKVDLSQEEIDAIDQKNKELRAQGQEPVSYDFYFNLKRNELFDEYVRSKGLLPSQKKQRIDQAIIDADARALAPSTYGDIFGTTIDITQALDEETLREKSKEINKNKIKRDYIISNIPSEKFINNANRILSEEAFRQIKKEADENFYNDFGEQEWQAYVKISGNTDPSLLGTEYEDDNKDDSALNKAVVIGDEDATVKNLQAMFPDFRIEGTGTIGEYITISTLSPEGEVVNSLEFYLEEENEPVKRIREFMQGALLTKKDKAFLSEDKSQSGNKLWQLDMYEYMLSNPQKFGNHDAPSMYGTDRAYETVKFDDIKRLIDRHEDDIPEERLERLNKLIEYADYYYKNQRRQKGSFASALSAGLMTGVSGPAKFAVNQMANVADVFGAEGAKEAKDGVITAIESMQNQVSGTDPESIAERNTLQTVINTMASSGSAMALGMGNPYATFGAFLTQTSPAVERLLKDEDMPEYQKGLMGLAMGSVEGALETYGAQALLTPASKGVFKGIVINAIKDLPADASHELIDLAIRNSIKAKLKAGVLQVAGGMVTEAATEAQQSMADDLNKRLFNALYEKDVFDVPDWTTTEGRRQWAEQIVESAKLGALSGGGFATIINAPRALKSGFKNKSQNKKFKNLYHTFSNASDVQQAKVKIQKGIDEGFIDRKTGEEYLNDWEEGYSVMSKIPDDLSMNLKREAYVLLSEKQQIEKKIAGKDKALEKKNYDRLKEINNALEFIGSQADTQQEEVKTKQQLKEERDAISKQETTPVDEDQQTRDVQKVEEGVPTAATEETTVEETTTEQVEEAPGETTVEETTTEQVEETPLTEEQQEVVDLEEEIEGRITEGRELPGQEQVAEQVTEEVVEEAPVDDRQLIYDESKSRSKGQQVVIDRAQRAIKAVSKILPDTKIIIHESSKDFKNATGNDGSGALIEGTIHLNMDKANDRTIAHEMMHAVLVNKLGTESDIRKVTARMLESVKKGLVDGGGKVQITTTEVIDGKEVKTPQDVTVEEYLDKFAENYDENMQNEEKVVELAGLLANNYTILKPKEKSVIRRWIQKIFQPIAKQLGININDVTKTDKDIIDFLNVVSRKTTTGDVITETETEVLTKVKEEAPAVKEKVTKKKPVVEEKGETVTSVLKGWASGQDIEVSVELKGKDKNGNDIYDNVKVDLNQFPLFEEIELRDGQKIKKGEKTGKKFRKLKSLESVKEGVSLYIEEGSDLFLDLNGIPRPNAKEKGSMGDVISMSDSKFVPATKKTTRSQKADIEVDILPIHKRGERITTRINEDKPISVLPLPERFLKGYEKSTDKKVSTKDKNSFLYKLGQNYDYKKGGVYIDISDKKQIKGYTATSGSINVNPENGRASLSVSEDVYQGEPSKEGRTIKTNLFKKKAGWSWMTDYYKSKYKNVETLVSVETGGQHVYTLGFDSTTPMDLKNYPEKKSEPRLRPTTKGQIFLGNYVGDIVIRGKEHPVYDKVYSFDPNDFQTLDRLNYIYKKPPTTYPGKHGYYAKDETYKKLKYYPENSLKDRGTDSHEYVFEKLGIKDAKYIGGGVEASVYDIGRGRVIRLSMSPSNISNNLVNKKIEGIVPVYSTGKVMLPKRMFGLDEKGNVLKKEDRDVGMKTKEHPPIYYQILKKGDTLNVKEDLDALLKRLFTYKRVKGIDTLFGSSIEYQLTNLSDSQLNQFKRIISKSQLKDLERLIQINKAFSDLGIKNRDSHTGNFVRNSNGDLEAVDLGLVFMKPGEQLLDVEEKNIIRQQKADIEVKSLPTSIQESLKFAEKSSFRNKLEFKNALQKNFNDEVFPIIQEKYGVKDNRSNTDENLKKYLLDAYLNETLTAIEAYPDALGWYDSRINGAMSLMEELHPELATDKDAASTFKIALAITSNGNKVYDNFVEANRQYEYFKENKRFDESYSIGDQRAGILSTLSFVNQALQSMSMKDFTSFLTTQYRAGDLKYIKDGKKVPLLPGFAVDEMVYGASIFGPKIGNGFFMNLYGEFNQLTMDRWFMRQYGRLTGTLIDFDQRKVDLGIKRLDKAKKALAKRNSEKLSQIIPGWDTMSSEELSNKIAKASMDLKKRAIFKSNPKLDEIRKAGNNLSKLLSAEAEAPRNSSQRKFINEVFTELQDVLKNEYNIDITIADLQAVNWYPEKALYQTFKADQNTKTGKTTTSDNEQPDYESAARKLVKSKGVSETKIKENEQRRNKQIKRDESNRNSIRERTIELNKDDKKSFETKRLKEKIISIKEDITRGDMNLSSQETSEIADREQKSLIQIGRYYNANNQGFFPAQVNEFQLRRDLEAIGLGLKRASSGAYYPTRNGRKVNIFPTPPSPYARFQRAEIDITEPTIFNKKDTAEDIIRTARKKGYNDKSIRFYLLNRRKGEFKAKEVDALLKLDATLFEQLPESFAEIEGGAIAGLKLYERIDKFRQKLMDQNNRIKKPFLEEQQIQELVKEKRKELKKQGLSKEEVREKLEAFEKKERANNKKRTKRLTLNEIMDKTIEFLEQQPEYKKSGDSYVEKGVVKYRKGISTQQAKMQAELQETIGQPPTRDMAESLAKLKKNVKAWEKGQRDLQAIKNELKRIMRKHLPKDIYTSKEVKDLTKIIADAKASNINAQIEKVQKLVVKKTNERLTREVLNLLNIKTQTIESGKLKGVKVSNEVRKRLEDIREKVLDPKKLSETDGERLREVNLKLTEQFNLINQQVTQTQEDIDNLINLQIAIALNQAQQLKTDNVYRIAPMQSAINSLDRLIVGGRGALQLELEQAHAEYQKQFAELWEQISGQKLDMSDPDIQDKIDERLKKELDRSDKERMRNKFRRILSMTYRITGQGINNHEALFGLMDKINVMPGELAGGRIQEIVTERVDEASIKYKGRVMGQEDIIDKKGQEIFGKGFVPGFRGAKWKNKVRQLQSVTDNVFYLDLKRQRKPISQNEMAYMYNQFKDPSLHPTFENMLGENYEEIMKDLESKLDPQLKEWADWMTDEYFPSVYDHYNETYKKIYRTDMPFNQNYAGRIFRESLDNNKPLDLLGNASISQTSIAPASIKVRDIKATGDILPMDINEALLSYMQDMEYFAAYAEPMRDINKMFNNKNTSDFLKRVYGENIQTLIKDQIQKISGKGTQNQKTAVVINFLNNSFIYAKIALSPVVFIKQLTSIFTYANDIGYGNWLLYSGASALKTPLGMGKTWREITNNSVYIQDRAKGANVKRAIGNYYDAKGQLLNNNFLEASQKALLITTKAGDKLAIMLGGMPNYLYYKAQYKKQNPQATEQEVIDYAVKKFEKDTKQTQQSSDLQDRDYYQTSDGFMRAMNMFLTTPKQYLRKEITALRNIRRIWNTKVLKREGAQAKGTLVQNARQFFTYHFVMPMLFQWVASGFPAGDDWDEEDAGDLIRAAVFGNINGAFILGDMLGSIVDFAQGKPWASDLNQIPLFIQVSDVIEASEKLVQKVNAKEPDASKIADARWDFFTALGGLFGLPFAQIKKAKNNINKVGKETDGKKMLLRILNYSDSVIEGPKEKKKKKKKEGLQPLEPLDGSGIKPLKPLGYTEEEKKDLAPVDALIKGLTDY